MLQLNYTFTASRAPTPLSIAAEVARRATSAAAMAFCEHAYRQNCRHARLRVELVSRTDRRWPEAAATFTDRLPLDSIIAMHLFGLTRIARVAVRARRQQRYEHAGSNGSVRRGNRRLEWGRRLSIRTEEVRDGQATRGRRAVPQPRMGLDGRRRAPLAARVPPAAHPRRAGAGCSTTGGS